MRDQTELLREGVEWIDRWAWRRRDNEEVRCVECGQAPGEGHAWDCAIALYLAHVNDALFEHEQRATVASSPKEQGYTQKTVAEVLQYYAKRYGYDGLKCDGCQGCDILDITCSHCHTEVCRMAYIWLCEECSRREWCENRDCWCMQWEPQEVEK